MKNKEFPNKLTNIRLIISFIIIVLLLFPFNMVNINFKKFLVNDTLIIDSKMVVVGILFIISCITDFLDGYLARKYNNVSDYGKLMDPIADKMSINSILIILSSYGYIHPMVPVIIIIRDTVINTLRMFAANSGSVEQAKNTGKFKTTFLMIGITLKLFGNLPFGLINVAVDDFFIIAGTILSLISGFEYYMAYKKYLFKN
ncbi:MAG: CDP-diacylglycerol--glycerol-3-phosphate 3-phosphatidyltransferase [Bacilli bacterium]|nr:CDP-diacylglycerol--glycerol-3-phosphate 3-phosphatidyltransferase [Bacilli bacterium]